MKNPVPNARLARAAPGEHLAEIFTSTERLIGTVAGFVYEGLRRDEGAILVLSPEHAAGVRQQLGDAEVDVARLESEDQLIIVDAAATLESLLTRGHPDPAVFQEVIGGLIGRVRNGDRERRVRIYGEMVQLLRERGAHRETVRLEQLWDSLVQAEGVCLLCGYSPSEPGYSAFPAELAELHTHVLRDQSSRERLIAAAQELFADGYEETTTSAIASRAGSSQSQIIKHFGSKEGLLMAIFEAWWGSVLESIAEIEADSTEPAEALTRILTRLHEGFREDPSLTRVLLFEGRRLRRGAGPLLSAGYLDFAESLERIFARAAARDQLADGLTPEIARDALIGACEGLARARLMASLADYPSSYGPDEMRRAFGVLINGLLKSSGSDGTGD